VRCDTSALLRAPPRANTPGIDISATGNATGIDWRERRPYHWLLQRHPNTVSEARNRTRVALPARRSAMKTHQKPSAVRKTWTLAVIVLALAGTSRVRNEIQDEGNPAKTLYVWSGDQARKAPDFLAVIDFDEDSRSYGEVVRTVPVPGPGSSGNEPHHCHLSADKNILAGGGLLALLRGQNSIFFFDVSQPRRPKFLFSTSGTLSNITDDFLPLKEGGFLVTQMGDHSGGMPGRVAEFDRNLSMVAEWPT